jgi:hypothetical protein
MEALWKRGFTLDQPTPSSSENDEAPRKPEADRLMRILNACEKDR